MKSLIKTATPSVKLDKHDGAIALAAPVAHEEAQCCAKVSKTIAGCHD